MILRHFGDKKRILVIVDSDADGYTSAAVLLNYLYVNFPSIVSSKIDYVFHPGKQHGINLDMIGKDIGLVITPDSSSNSYEEHEALKEQGIDVLVIDHHQAESISPNACVVNNQLCDYPTKSLSGVGMVYKVCQRFDELCGFCNANDNLDLVALGLVSDMMDLRDFETRHLIMKGLGQIRNPFMKAMREKNSYKLGYDSITATGVAFYITPFINAVTRVGTQEEKRLLFESMLIWKACKEIPSTKRGCKGQSEQLVEQVVRNCVNIKSRQTRVQDENVEAVEKIIEKNHLLDYKLLMIKLEDFSIDRNLSGLIANRLMSKYQRPVAVLNKNVDDKNQILWEGSARGYDKSDLKDFRQFVYDSGCARLAQGHPSAFGISFTDQGLKEFISYSEKELKDMSFEPSYKVDFIWYGSSFRAKDISEIISLEEYYGQNINEPYIAIENLKLTGDKLILMAKDRNPTLKIILPNGVSCLKFKSSEEEYNQLYSESGCVTINLVGRCQNNVYGGITTPQILIDSYEIIDKQKYYF